MFVLLLINFIVLLLSQEHHFPFSLIVFPLALSFLFLFVHLGFHLTSTTTLHFTNYKIIVMFTEIPKLNCIKRDLKCMTITNNMQPRNTVLVLPFYYELILVITCTITGLVLFAFIIHLLLLLFMNWSKPENRKQWLEIKWFLAHEAFWDNTHFTLWKYLYNILKQKSCDVLS